MYYYRRAARIGNALGERIFLYEALILSIYNIYTCYTMARSSRIFLGGDKDFEIYRLLKILDILIV